MRERRSGFDIANCGQQGAFAEQRPLPPAARSREKYVLTAQAVKKELRDKYSFSALIDTIFQIRIDIAGVEDFLCHCAAHPSIGIKPAIESQIVL